MAKRVYSPFEILGVRVDATDYEIRTEFLKRVRVAHTDKNGAGKFKINDINYAYELLSDPHSRMFFEVCNGNIEEAYELAAASKSNQESLIRGTLTEEAIEEFLNARMPTFLEKSCQLEALPWEPDDDIYEQEANERKNRENQRKQREEEAELEMIERGKRLKEAEAKKQAQNDIEEIRVEYTGREPDIKTNENEQELDLEEVSPNVGLTKNETAKQMSSDKANQETTKAAAPRVVRRATRQSMAKNTRDQSEVKQVKEKVKPTVLAEADLKAKINANDRTKETHSKEVEKINSKECRGKVDRKRKQQETQDEKIKQKKLPTRTEAIPITRKDNVEQLKHAYQILIEKFKHLEDENRKKANEIVTLKRIISKKQSKKSAKVNNKCKQCNWTSYSITSFRAALSRHMAEHHREPKFNCKVCKRPFARKDSLTRHLKTHKAYK